MKTVPNLDYYGIVLSGYFLYDGLLVLTMVMNNAEKFKSVAVYIHHSFAAVAFLYAAVGCLHCVCIITITSFLFVAASVVLDRWRMVYDGVVNAVR